MADNTAPAPVTIDPATAEGIQLDWMVALALGEASFDGYYFPFRFRGAWMSGKFRYSTDPALAYQMLEHFEVDVDGNPARAPHVKCQAVTDNRVEPMGRNPKQPRVDAWGPTRAIAACRAIAIANFGREMTIPAILQ